MQIFLKTDAKLGRVRIELSEEQPTMTVSAKELLASEAEQVHVRAHWRRRTAKP